MQKKNLVETNETSSKIRFADEKTKYKIYELQKGNFEEKQLFKFINEALDNIEENAFCGVQIPKKLIPKEYSKKYRIKNLWKYNLPKGERLIYSIVNDEIIVVSIILEWLEHKDYEKRFKY
jgi:Txe/YoeB family toxin of Txe-Axe toxin-antitoxin module